MTNEEARAYFIDSNERIISVAKDENRYNYETQQIEDVFMRKDFEAKKLAIKALEQTELSPSYNSVKTELKPCEDCISREDALKAIEEQKKGFYGVERYAIDECHSAVMKLPPVRPYREIVEDKRACENCIHYVTRDSKGVVLCGCDSWECDFEEVKT